MLAVPAYPGLRLWPDSWPTVGPGTVQPTAPAAHYSSKRRVTPLEPRPPAARFPLRALFVLERAQTPPPSVERLSGARAVMALVRSSFRLDHRDPAVLRRQLEQWGQLLPRCLRTGWLSPKGSTRSKPFGTWCWRRSVPRYKCTLQRSVELYLVLSCARAALEGSGTAAIRQTLSGTVDWERVLSLSLRHALLPLVWRPLRAFPELVPAAAQVAFARAHVAIAARGASLTQELGRLLRLLEGAGVEALAYKGPALAVQLYGDVQARAFLDLDLPVRPRDFGRCRALLIGTGTRRCTTG